MSRPDGEVTAKRKRVDGPAGGGGGDGGGAPGERPGGRGDAQPNGPRKSPRLVKQEAVLAPPTLTFTSKYTGVRRQHLDQVESIGFYQRAVLAIGAAPRDIKHYYEFRQEVRDSYTRISESQDLSNWTQDSHYHPDYTGSKGMITTRPDAIQFDDNPGFSTNAAIAVDDWLHDYDIWFRWRVTRCSDGKEWVSPEVHHTVTSQYTDIANGAPVKATAAGAHQWTADTFV